MSDETRTRIASQLLRAALAQFDAQRQTALAILDIYLHKPTAVGDHPNLVGEIVQATKDLAAAEEAMESLERNFIASQELLGTDPPLDPEIVE
jgi:hypothetical protein|tara:strand:- start:1594 stop:1872 length:279 start_codon:yes stop_codon:yes gene_type:complete